MNLHLTADTRVMMTSKHCNQAFRLRQKTFASMIEKSELEGGAALEGHCFAKKEVSEQIRRGNNANVIFRLE